VIHGCVGSGYKKRYQGREKRLKRKKNIDERLI
jgi:hypothetical protein